MVYNYGNTFFFATDSSSDYACANLPDTTVTSFSKLQQACLLSWERATDEPTGVCDACLGAGTVRSDGSAIRHEQVPPDEQRPCAACSGTGRGAP